jgi:hypothetical protein
MKGTFQLPLGIGIASTAVHACSCILFPVSIPFRLPGSNQEKKGTLLGGFPYMSRSFPFLGDQVGEVSLTFLPVCRSFYIA